MPYKENGKWIAQVKINGKKVKRRCANKKEALEWEAKTRIYQIDNDEPLRHVSLIEWSEAYLEFSKAKFVSNTYYEKHRAFRAFFDDLPKTDIAVDQLKPITLLKHFQNQAKLRSGNAANKDRKNLAAAWVWGHQYLNMPYENPFQRINKQGEIRHDRRIPSLAEFWKVYNVTTTPQDKCMLLCYLYSGARRGELFQLLWQDVDFFNSRIRLHWKKNKLGTVRSAWVSMTDEAMEALKEQHRRTADYKWVFIEPETGLTYQCRLQWMRRLCARAKVERFGFHGIRHLCASILAGKGVPLIDIQHHLRHDHLSTTERYIHQIQESRAVANALSGLMSAFISPGPQRAPNIACYQKENREAYSTLLDCNDSEIKLISAI